MTGWTLDELVRRASEALAAQHVRVQNGRVTPLPDRRVVRWYSTIGLVDRPVAYRGRTALYGPRHLLQVVAVKRRQAEGRSLAEIQAELTGATDGTLGTIAQLPDPVEEPAIRARFWTAPPAPSVSADTPSGRSVAAPSVSAPAAPSVSAPAAVDGPALAAPGGATPGLRYAVELRPGVTLTLPGQPGPDDLTEIRAAARPLLDLLAQRGLLPAESLTEGG
jgi:hypothetical protein